MLHSTSREEQVRLTFSAELDARVPALNRALLRLERAGADAAQREMALWDLFRGAHNLKAAARAVHNDGVEHTAVVLEATIAQARRPGETPPAADWFDRAYALLDALAGQRGESSELESRVDFAAAETSPTSPSPTKLAVAQPTLVALPAQPPGVETVRVAVDKLDALLAQAGELAVTHLRVRERQAELRTLREDFDLAGREWRNTRGVRANLRRGGRASRELEALLRQVDQVEQRNAVMQERIDHLAAQLGRDTAQLGLVTRAVEEEVMSVRLLPIATISTLLERTLRDLIRSTGKEVQLIVEGADTEIDRKILEQVRDPMMHLLRNAVDHGIEAPDVRLAGGKPRGGTVRVSAALRGGFVEIEMSDDGAGIDPLHLRASAVRKGLLTVDQGATLDDVAVLDVIFQPGFSTRTTVTELSGRGVGLDVVRQNIGQLNGQVSVVSELDHGTRFILRVPLTLATTRAVLVEESGQLLALPSTLIERIARVRQRHIATFEGRRAVTVDGRPVPVVDLASILQRPATGAHAAEEWRPFVILQQGERRLAVLTEKLLGEQEIVVKSLGWPLDHVPNVSGAAVLGSGQTVVILNPADLLNNGSRIAMALPGSASATPPPEERHIRRLLVVDDSLTTRTLIRSILEAGGYHVVVAGDGLEALTLLRGSAFDLVVADVEMPRMDGFELVEAVRRDERLRQTPVILITSLADREHRERGMAAGADAYVVKNAFDQGQLLESVDRLL